MRGGNAAPEDEVYPWNRWYRRRSFAPGAWPWNMIEEQNPSSVSAYISVRDRIRKEMGKDGKGEAGIENRGKGTPSPLIVRKPFFFKGKQNMHSLNRHSFWSSDILAQEIDTKTKSNQGHDFARYLADVLTYSIRTCLAFKLVNPSATSKCHILYLSFPNRLLCLVTQQL